MATLLVFGAGHRGAVMEGDVTGGTARIISGNLVRTRDGNPPPQVNITECFTVREFVAYTGKAYLIAEFETGVPDDALEKRIAYHVILDRLQ